MAPKFTPPPFDQTRTPEEAFAAPLGKAIEGIPSLILQHKKFKREQELADDEHKNKRITNSIAIAEAQMKAAQIAQSHSYLPPNSTVPVQLPGVTGYSLTQNPDGTVTYGPTSGGIPDFGSKDIKFPPNPPVPPQQTEVTNPVTGEVLRTTSNKVVLADQTAPQKNALDSRSTAKALQQAKNIRGALSTIDQLENAWNAMRSEGKTGIGVKTGISYVSGKAEQDKTVSSYNSLREGLKAYIGRNIGEDVGNFAQKEGESYLGLIPGQIANPETAKAKFDQMRQLIKAKANALNETYGIDVNSIQSQSLHNAALEWANANPDDPRSASIREKALAESAQ